MTKTTSRRPNYRVIETSQGALRVGTRQLRLLNSFAKFDDGVLQATVWSHWAAVRRGAPQWNSTADVLIALRDKGLIEATDTGLFDLFEARLLPDYRITALGREAIS